MNGIGMRLFVIGLFTAAAMGLSIPATAAATVDARPGATHAGDDAKAKKSKKSNSPQKPTGAKGVVYRGGTVAATADPALGRLAQPPPTDGMVATARLTCTSATSCVVSDYPTVQVGGREGALGDAPAGPLALTGTARYSAPGSACAGGAEVTVVTDLTVTGKTTIGGKAYPARLSGTLVFSSPPGQDPNGPSGPNCGGETYTYTFRDAVPVASGRN